MGPISLPCLFWLILSIQVVSLAVIIALQLLPCGSSRTVCQRVFFGLLLAMGLVTVSAVGAASSAWLWSGASLSIMTVCATCDLGGATRGPASF